MPSLLTVLQLYLSQSELLLESLLLQGSMHSLQGRDGESTALDSHSPEKTHKRTPCSGYLLPIGSCGNQSELILPTFSCISWGRKDTESRNNSAENLEGITPWILYSPFSLHIFLLLKGFLGGSVVKNLPANLEDVCLIPGLDRSPEEGNGNPLQYSGIGNPMDRGAWQSTVQGVIKELGTS